MESGACACQASRMEVSKAVRRSRSVLMKKPILLLILYSFSFFFVGALFRTFTHQNQDLSSCSSSSGQQKAAAALRFQSERLASLGLGLNIADKGEAEEKMMRMGRRFLGWPGSSPPRCASKCGKCTPCKPVHVAVPPGTPVTEEYYPEAWRCKCGNNLYMP